ncbi:MAG: hypothetical protein NXY59_08990 [Aigarchaeota archaeon]|nr:hypothetical protein [Candidatus Pelearchaeum maunauluense]
MRESILYLLVGAGSFVQAGSGWWDVFSHRIEFVDFDPWWNPAHTGLYAGALLILLAVLRASKTGTSYAWLHAIKAAALLQLVAGGLNEVVHRVPSLEAYLDFTVHSLFTLGMLIIALTLFTGLSIHSTLVGRMHGAVIAALILSGGSLWLVSSGSVMYLFSSNPAFVLALLAFISSTITITAVSAVGAAGVSFLVWLAYVAAVYAVFVGYAGEPPYIPLGVASVIAAEAAIRVAARKHREVLGMFIGGALLGAALRLTYYPLTEYYYRLYGGGVDFLAAGLLGGLAGNILIMVGGKILIERGVLPYPHESGRRAM